MTKKSQTKPVLITTERRGVFVGQLESYDEEARVAILLEAQMAIYWGTTNGLFELAATGPTAKSKVSARVPRVRLELVECVVDLTPAAAEAWAKR